MPNYIFSNAGVSLVDLKKFNYSSHHTTVADKVLSGEYDAGVVKEAVVEIYKDHGLKIFHIAPKRTTIPLVVSKHTDQKTRQSIMMPFCPLMLKNLRPFPCWSFGTKNFRMASKKPMTANMN